MIELFGGPDRDRTDDLFHAMEARSQLRHRPTPREGLIYSLGCGGASQPVPVKSHTDKPKIVDDIRNKAGISGV